MLVVESLKLQQPQNLLAKIHSFEPCQMRIRTCILIPSKIDKKLQYKEAEYYGILNHVWSAECDKFDGNRPRLARSITGQSVRDGLICRSIHASPSGLCCVAHGSMVHVYDWMLEECRTINLDYHKVNDVCWVDSENVVVSSDNKLDREAWGYSMLPQGS